MIAYGFGKEHCHETEMHGLAAVAVFALATGAGLALEGTIAEFAGTEAAKDPAYPLASLPFKGVIRCLGGGNRRPRTNCGRPIVRPEPGQPRAAEFL
jgi:hypothetical protein